jgi:two-component system cell cycle response regulator CpdR
MPRRALVADDDPLTLELIASMLEELACETVTARSGTDARGQLAKDRSIDILFKDINMPGLSGLEIAERARDFRPELRVLLVSGRKSDAHGFLLLRKPFSQSDRCHQAHRKIANRRREPSRYAATSIGARLAIKWQLMTPTPRL